MPTVYSPPVSTYVALATTTLGATAASVTFSSIPADYRDLVLVIEGEPSGTNPMDIDLNGDSTNANYFGVIAYQQGAGSAASFNVNETYIGVNYYNSYGRTQVTVQFLDYSANDKHKHYLVRSGAAGGWIAMSAHRWENTNPISTMRIDLRGGSFTTGTTFSLFGIEA
jgi:ABC-type molybdate transport system substrate-binding protein